MVNIFEKEEIERKLQKLLQPCPDPKCDLNRNGTSHLKHKIIKKTDFKPVYFIFLVIIATGLGISSVTSDKDFQFYFNSAMITILIGFVSIWFAKQLFLKQNEHDNWSRKIQHATTYFNEKDWSKAKSYYDKALEIKPNDIESLNNAGSSLIRLEKYVEAIPYFTKILEQDRNNLAGLNNIAWCYNKIGNYIKSESFYEQSLSIDPKFLDALNNLGVLYLESYCKYDKAIEYFEQILELEPDDPYAYANIAIALNKKEKFHESLLFSNKALEIEPKFQTALHQKGFSLFKLKKFDEVISCGELLLQLNPIYFKQIPKKLDQNEIIFNLALSYANLKKFDQARKCIDDYITTNPNNSLALRYKGDILTSLEEHQKALESYDLSLKLNSKQPEVLNNKGVILWDLGQRIQAILCFDEAIKIRSSSATAWYNKGVKLTKDENEDIVKECHEKVISIPLEEFEDSVFRVKSMIFLKKYDDAITLLDSLLMKDPKDLQVLLLKADVYQKFDNENAIKTCEEILEFYPDNIAALGGKGVALFRQKKFEQALNFFNKVLELDHFNLVALKNKNTTFYDMGKYDRSVNTCNLILSKDPTNADAFYDMGMALMKLQKFNQALDCFTNCSEIQPKKHDSFLSMGNCYLELGQFDDAINSFKRSLDLNPSESRIISNISLTYAKMNNYEEAWNWWNQFLEKSNLGRDQLDALLRKIRIHGPYSIQIMSLGDYSLVIV